MIYFPHATHEIFGSKICDIVYKQKYREPFCKRGCKSMSEQCLNMICINKLMLEQGKYVELLFPQMVKKVKTLSCRK